jgi:hypothetical protein
MRRSGSVGGDPAGDGSAGGSGGDAWESKQDLGAEIQPAHPFFFYQVARRGTLEATERRTYLDPGPYLSSDIAALSYLNHGAHAQFQTTTKLNA